MRPRDSSPSGATAQDRRDTPSTVPDGAAALDALLPAGAIEQALGQTLREALDLTHWDEGGNLESLLTRVEQTVRRSVEQEEQLSHIVRNEVLARLQSFPDAPPQAGVYAVPEQLLNDARRN